MTKDYYKTLGIPRNATKEDVKKAYRAMAHKYHPDKGGDEARFKEVNEAYQVLSDDDKRAQYDQFGRVFEGGGGQQGGFEWPGGFKFDFGGPFEDTQGRGFADFDFSDIFEDFLGMNFGGGSRSKSRGSSKGRDIRINLDVSFEESILGSKKEMEFPKLAVCERCKGSGGEPGTHLKNCATCQGRGNIQKTQRTFLGSFTQVSACQECLGAGKKPEIACSLCQGKGIRRVLEKIEVFIPKGINDGEILKITGKGETSLAGGVPGDLYLKLRVLPHKIFKRQGDDIIMQLPVKLSQAVLGDSIEIETLDGTLRLKISEGTQPGDILRLRGKGSYQSSGYGRGDLLIEIKVEIPKKISRKVRDRIQELKEEGV